MYLGHGKGKTTAAVGLAVRARGWNKRVCFIQFIKEERWPSGERAMLKKLKIYAGGDHPHEAQCPRILEL